MYLTGVASGRAAKALAGQPKIACFGCSRPVAAPSAVRRVLRPCAAALLAAALFLVLGSFDQVTQNFRAPAGALKLLSFACARSPRPA